MKPTALFARGKPRSRGACAAELALLVPFVYLPLVAGAIYIGWLATARERVYESDQYLVQRRDPATTDEIQGIFFREFTGRVTQAVGSDDPEPDVPSPGEIQKLFEMWTTKPTFWSSNPTAHVEFYLDGSTIRSRMIVDPGRSGSSIPWEGQMVQAWGLLNNNVPDDLSNQLLDFMHRRDAYTEYLHSWVLDREAWAPQTGAGGNLSRWNDDGSSRSLRATGDSGTRGWNLSIPNPAFRPQWTIESAIRWDKTRMARDQTPPASSERAFVPNGCSNNPPGCVKTDDYWHPGDATKPAGGAIP